MPPIILVPHRGWNAMAKQNEDNQAVLLDVYLIFNNKTSLSVNSGRGKGGDFYCPSLCSTAWHDHFYKLSQKNMKESIAEVVTTSPGAVPYTSICTFPKHQAV